MVAGLAASCAMPLTGPPAPAPAPVVFPQAAPVTATPAPASLAPMGPLTDADGRPACGNVVFKGVAPAVCDPG